MRGGGTHARVWAMSPELWASQSDLVTSGRPDTIRRGLKASRNAEGRHTKEHPAHPSPPKDESAGGPPSLGHTGGPDCLSGLQFPTYGRQGGQLTTEVLIGAELPRGHAPEGGSRATHVTLGCCLHVPAPVAGAPDTPLSPQEQLTGRGAGSDFLHGGKRQKRKDS